MKRRKSDLGLAILWFITGILVLCTPEVSKISYGLCWAVLVLHYISDYAFGNLNYSEGFRDGALDAIDRCSKVVEEVFEIRRREREEGE